MPKYSQESLDRIAEAQARIDSYAEKKDREREERKLRWDEYEAYLAKMPEFKPGARRSFSPITNIKDMDEY